MRYLAALRLRFWFKTIGDTTLSIATREENLTEVWSTIEKTEGLWQQVDQAICMTEGRLAFMVQPLGSNVSVIIDEVVTYKLNGKFTTAQNN